MVDQLDKPMIDQFHHLQEEDNTLLKKIMQRDMTIDMIKFIVNQINLLSFNMMFKILKLG